MAKRAKKSQPIAEPQVTADSQEMTFKHPNLFVAAALAVLTLLIYAPVLGHEFISLDDTLYVTENPMVNRGLSFAGLTWAFTTFHAANWHPLTWIAHMIDSQIFGMNAGGHLFVNTLIHATNVTLVFALLYHTTGFRWRSALVAALFALHPLHVESVAWVAERKDTLSTLFGLLSLIAYCRYVQTGSRAQYAWSAGALVLGLLAKPMLVTWPFVMLLLDFWPLARFQRSEIGGQRSVKLIVDKIPFLLIVAGSAVITMVAQSHGGAVRNFADAPIWLRASNAVVAYAKYLLLTFWPNNLAVYYPFDLQGIPEWQIIGAIFLLLAVTAFCAMQIKKRPYLLFGWLWFLGTLLPVIGLVQVGGQTMADRYHYIPSIGLFTALVFGFAEVVKPFRLSPTIAGSLAGAILLVLAVLTSMQLRLWHDSTSLFRHTLAVTPPNMIIEHNFGLVLGKSGELDEAATHFEKALQIRPDFYDALINMGVTRSQQHRLPEAVTYFQHASAIQREKAEPHFQLGLLYANLNQDQKALGELQQAVRIEPENSDTRANLGLVFLRLRNVSEAVAQLQEALRLNPQNAEAHNNLGLAFLVSGKVQESIPEFETALRLKPDLQLAAQNLRRAQAKMGAGK
jgi:tetratricopeptide (TPR) repeat protein